jgi:MoCo/4Fe-4S cofactor protein with predicted Tat translocation signal
MSARTPGLPTLPPGPDAAAGLDLVSVSRRLREQKGRGLWRSLEELARTPAFEEALRHEFPEGAREGLDRRDLLKFLSVSFALAGLTGCTRQPEEKIVPYVTQPEDVLPGKPLFFATAMTLGGYATGLLVESHMGRPTKAEGNPLHPASLGATDLFSQASLYGLYDPDRSQALVYLDEIRAWPAFLGDMQKAVAQERLRKGAGLRLLTETVSSPTLARQIRELLKDLPDAKWIQWEAAGRDAVRAGARLAFGEPLNAVYRMDRAEVIVSLGSDFLFAGPGQLRYTRDFAERRRQLASATGKGVRLYAFESTCTVTGANADHRRPIAARQMEPLARSLARAVGVPLEGAPAPDAFLAAVAKDLAAHRGAGLVVVGDAELPAVHALAHAMNAALGNAGETVLYTDPVEAEPADQLESLKDLVSEMRGGAVTTMVILGGNPAFTAPADLDFAAALQNVPTRVHLSLYQDETSALCQWNVPETHFLEAWSDARAFDGTASIVQPLIAPLYDGKSAHEVLAALSRQPEKSGYDLVRETWRPSMGPHFEDAWRRALHDGIVAGTASPAKKAAVRPLAAPASPRPAEAKGLELVLRPDASVHDGRFANNGWLQELSRPFTRLTWDNAVLVSVATAARLGLEKEDVVLLSYRGRSARGPVWIEPGLPDDTVTAHFGQGRVRSGHFGNGAGFNAYPLRFSDGLWSAEGVMLTKTGDKRELACTQLHQNMEGRELVRAATLEEFRLNPGFAREMEAEPKESLYAPYPRDVYAWALAIDLQSCVGCNICELACQAENNVPVVGKDQVHRGREMHWIRIDHYYAGDPSNPEHFFQPVPCMQCENAPCELVCPVGATLHSAEGLNDMVYNRCVGTRYCSNNCPYKVRRFNFYHYSTQFRAPSLKMLANPDVTVRWRGVMEKCTYCVQRINAAKIQSEIAGRRVRDGEITPACAQACPAQAIVFGDLADPESRVSKRREDPRHYGLLAAEAGTRPRTTYLAAVKNPNPEIGGKVETHWALQERETGQK